MSIYLLAFPLAIETKAHARWLKIKSSFRKSWMNFDCVLFRKWTRFTITFICWNWYFAHGQRLEWVRWRNPSFACISFVCSSPFNLDNHAIDNLTSCFRRFRQTKLKNDEKKKKTQSEITHCFVINDAEYLLKILESYNIFFSGLGIKNNAQQKLAVLGRNLGLPFYSIGISYIRTKYLPFHTFLSHARATKICTIKYENRW